MYIVLQGTFEQPKPNLIEQIKNMITSLMAYSSTWKQPINFQKTFWILFHQQVTPTIPAPIDCNGHLISHCNQIKYLDPILDCKLSFSSHLSYIETKIHKNISLFKQISSSSMISEAVAYLLYNVYIRPY